MEIIDTGFEGLIAVEPDIYTDARGNFFESYHLAKFKELGISEEFIQDNQSYSDKHVLRGLHFQKAPFEQGKLVRVVTGRAIDIALDIRRDSKTFGQYFKYELDSVKNNFLYIPGGFAHGFLSLEKTIFFYKCTEFYDKQSEVGILWDDKDLKIDWGVKNPLVSEKDQKLPTFQEFLNNIEK